MITKKLTIQCAKFFVTSGSGWLLDFGFYLFLSHTLNFNVAYANMISCIPALTFVFIISTRKIFHQRESKIPLKSKYFIYFFYQLILVFCVSWLGQAIYQWIFGTHLMQILIASHLKLICKLMVTPITMTINFFVMKYLSEKL